MANEQFLNKVLHGNCLELMQEIETSSIDMILCDLPYGVTARNKWDFIIPFDQLWEQYNRIIKDNGAIVLTATQPFASQLIMSNPKMFKYDWIWEKDKATGHLNAKKMPMRAHEYILVFYKKPPTYNPQKTTGHKPANQTNSTQKKEQTNYGDFKPNPNGGYTDRYPRTVQRFNTVNSAHGVLHPTQKPTELFSYLIRTYTNEQDTVLDNTAGSGTTAVSCIETNRNFILIEQEWEYCEIANERIKQAREQKVNY